MESLVESGVLWSLLLEQESPSLWWSSRRFLDEPADAGHCCLHGSEEVPAVLSPTYKQRNEDFRKLFKQLPDTERLIVDYSCALQRDILLVPAEMESLLT
ncbi:Hypothetical predicted protein [Marmota monax]|uniref:Uncharacterized protein n=1 Tax=Marmota monax TaxID=9995 RepID=A0A5E4ANY5_MARMO|nr:Hypothetical predicted protein [Marmota monax]